MRKQSGDIKFQTEVLVRLVHVVAELIILTVSCQSPQQTKKMIKLLAVPDISKDL